ncbi:SRPBCC family protein [Nocardia sp. CA-084685]|uniref:SRPBCC family protein n=1 Tax=Nocardia sp. CA-084685 TaxID=3239970 RepID=UPI003D97C1F1
MTTIATAQATSTAAPAAFFAKWADMATWPEWNNDTEWVRLDGPFAQGATGALKPKGGPEVPFDHQIATGPERTTVTVTVSIEGPLSWFWTKVMGADLADSVEPDLRALVAAAEAVLV